VREVLATQIDLRKDDVLYVPVGELPDDHRYFALQATYQTEMAPSERVIDETRATRGREYRDETDGAHPVAELRQTAAV
jgi:hypothetical protein